MKLRTDFITQDIDDIQFLVPVGPEAGNNIIRSNKTAAFIVDCLKEETTEEEIINAMCKKYNTTRENISADVEEIISKLREIHALEA